MGLAIGTKGTNIDVSNHFPFSLLIESCPMLRFHLFQNARKIPGVIRIDVNERRDKHRPAQFKVKLLHMFFFTKYYSFGEKKA